MKHKWFLYVTGFFSGMSVMAIELGAQRMLAPYFSSSQIVWTIVIGVIMIAMALGNVLGGRMADKHRDPKHLFLWLFAAAVWAALIPLFGKFVIAGVAIGLAMIVTKNYLIWAALCSCILVFVFPLLVLGMVTPNLVKFALHGDGGSGKTVGIIEALNTIGSILGTFLPTFVTIPNVGTALTFLIFAAILLCIAVSYFLFFREKPAGEKRPGGQGSRKNRFHGPRDLYRPGRRHLVPQHFQRLLAGQRHIRGRIRLQLSARGGHPGVRDFLHQRDVRRAVHQDEIRRPYRHVLRLCPGLPPCLPGVLKNR